MAEIKDSSHESDTWAVFWDMSSLITGFPFSCFFLYPPQVTMCCLSCPCGLVVTSVLSHCAGVFLGPGVRSSAPDLPGLLWPRALLLPHGLKLSVFDVRELRRAQTALHTVSCSGKPFLLHSQTEAGHRGSLDLYLVAGGLESVEERQREGRQTVGDGD